MTIKEAKKTNAPDIGKAIVAAITPDLVLESFNPYTPTPAKEEEYVRFFTSLAELEDSQYSYRNTLVAVNSQDEVQGVIIGYDGALLHKLRNVFVNEIYRQLGVRLPEPLPDETSPDEFYIDTLAVIPAARKQGIGASLLRAMIEHGHQSTGKPVGLLVDKTNQKARSLYEKVGFRKKDERLFFEELMDHLQA